MSNQPKTKRKRRPKVTQDQKDRAFLLLSDGWGLRQIETELDISRGTLSKWRRSEAFALYHANRTTGQGGTTRYEIAARSFENVEPPKVEEGDVLGEIEVRGRFLSAVACGALSYAQAYSGATDEQVCRWLKDLDTAKAHAKPRVLCLSRMLKIATGGDEVPYAVKVKALSDWWRLANNDIGGDGPTINIDARGVNVQEEEAPITSFLTDQIRDQLATARDLDLMGETPSYDTSTQ